MSWHDICFVMLEVKAMNDQQRTIMRILLESPLYNLLSPVEKLAWVKETEQKLNMIQSRYRQHLGRNPFIERSVGI